MRILAKELLNLYSDGEKEPAASEQIELCGWIHRIRELGAVNFVVLRDRSALIQLVLDGKCPYPLESVVRVSGNPARNPKAPGGAELRVISMELLGGADGNLPYQVNADVSKIGLEAILDNRALSLRNPKIRSIFKVQSTIIEAFGSYLRAHDFTEIKTSKLVAGSTEGGTELFEVDYFDRKLCLAQSPQQYKQMMVASGLERVFEVAPAYRAEKHDTPRHLNEYVSMDIEMGFIESEIDLIELEKELLAHIFEEVAAKNAADVAAWQDKGASVPVPDGILKAPIVGYEEALKIVNTTEGKTGQGQERIFDMSPEAERRISVWSEKEYGTPLVFVNDFPRRLRPFYTYPSGASGTMSFDAIFRGLEITTGGRRHNEYEVLAEALPRFGLKKENMEGYLSIFKYGCPPHGGFAIGCERLTQKLLGLTNVKEASLFPRDRKRITP
ncbi:MAG: aspartate--tRNA(Asn) ligase [Spirochaetaceae bacterium]|jgi:nondiscriminating aspartyl-tRNA synthetase|nr:aspartate--tRNA(Asn) ligase [Spirochaetaceae bacterium]